MQSPASFLHAYAILESEFDADSMLDQLASQKETAARAPFMAPAYLRRANDAHGMAQQSSK